MISTVLGFGASLFAPKLLSQFRDQKIQIIHAMPGRLRMQCDKWKDAIVAQCLEKEIVNETLVLTCKASSVTGSLLIEFIVPHISEQELDELMKRIVTVTSEAVLHTEAKMMKTMQQTLQVVDRGIKRQTNGFADFDSLFVLFLLGKGIHSFKRAPAFAASLLYWSYTIIKNKEGTDAQ
ncbi:HMA2 domain-containing protein [Ectobacillus panaciterrae]|uniref:HMA2 domain-containing protein n=1 Tax=Ectobacillus panaciterrae TaxID=363872 RepID=UPI0004284F7C|nr:hypothetical protein [Ectobacillus panaciterrae]